MTYCGPKWSEERAALWVSAYREMGNITFACDAVGITPKTFYAWMERGERGDPGFESFYFEAKRARASRANELMKAAERDKGGPAFLLGALFPSEFGQSGRAGRDAMQTILDTVWPHLSDGARQEFLSALATVERQRAGASDSGVADGQADRAGPAVIDVAGESVQAVLPASTKPHS